jgi:hypothetical protein
MQAAAGYREEFRRKHIGSGYAGWGHFAFTTAGSLATIAFAASRLSDVKPWEWSLIPLFFLIANLAEYFGHRGPMHHRRRGLGLVFERHTLQHHRFFTQGNMACESARDFKIVLFPPVMLAFFIGGIATPLGALAYVLVSPNAGYLFAVVGISYFLTYEWLHFAYHQPEDSVIARLPGIARLREHHRTHHDPTLMSRWNFNITFPIGDRLMGTFYRGDERSY